MRTRPMCPLLPSLAFAAAAALGCNSQDTTQPSAIRPGDLTRAPSVAVSTASTDTSGLSPFPSSSHFVRVVDNLYFPLPLGRRLVYHGTEDGEREKIVTDVTRLQKTILGVPVVTVLDRVYLAGMLIEKTFDWYAEDDQGNVWYFGEDTKEFDENGNVVSTAGSFEAGKNGAKAGIIMRSHRMLGQVTPQEFAPGVAEDKAKIVAMNATVPTPYKTFQHCFRTDEFTALEPDVLENKFYCPGVGVVRERDVKGGTVNTALTSVVQR